MSEPQLHSDELFDLPSIRDVSGIESCSVHRRTHCFVHPMMTWLSYYTLRFAVRFTKVHLGVLANTCCNHVLDELDKKLLIESKSWFSSLHRRANGQGSHLHSRDEIIIVAMKSRDVGNFQKRYMQQNRLILFGYHILTFGGQPAILNSTWAVLTLTLRILQIFALSISPGRSCHENHVQGLHRTPNLLSARFSRKQQTISLSRSLHDIVGVW